MYEKKQSMCTELKHMCIHRLKPHYLSIDECVLHATSQSLHRFRLQHIQKTIHTQACGKLSIIKIISNCTFTPCGCGCIQEWHESRYHNILNLLGIRRSHHKRFIVCRWMHPCHQHHHHHYRSQKGRKANFYGSCWASVQSIFSSEWQELGNKTRIQCYWMFDNVLYYLFYHRLKSNLNQCGKLKEDEFYCAWHLKFTSCVYSRSLILMDSWLNEHERKTRERERERMLAESSGIDQMEQSYIWESTSGFHLYYSVTNQLLVCLKFSSLYVVWVCNEKWQVLPAHKWWAHVFFGKKIAATLTVLTKCSHYKLLLLLLYIHVCMCTAKQLNIVHLNYLITINIIAWNSERVMYRVIIGCAFSRTQRVNVVNKHSSRNIQCLSIQFLSSSYTDGLVCPCPYSRVEIVNFVYL